MSVWPSSPSPDTPGRLQSTLQCPFCGKEEELTMPEHACVIMRRCSGCERMMRPAGDCCVFCSYGSMPCPPVQERRRRRGMQGGDAAGG